MLFNFMQEILEKSIDARNKNSFWIKYKMSRHNLDIDTDSVEDARVRRFQRELFLNQRLFPAQAPFVPVVRSRHHVA